MLAFQINPYIISSSINIFTNAAQLTFKGLKKGKINSTEVVSSFYTNAKADITKLVIENYIKPQINTYRDLSKEYLTNLTVKFSSMLAETATISKNALKIQADNVVDMVSANLGFDLEAAQKTKITLNDIAESTSELGEYVVGMGIKSLTKWATDTIDSKFDNIEYNLFKISTDTAVCVVTGDCTEISKDFGF